MLKFPRFKSSRNLKWGFIVWVSKALQSPVMAKILMALTGLMLIGFLVGHLTGNMLIFAGPDALNTYAEGLRKFPALLWVARIGIIAAAIIHVMLAKRLTKENMAASNSKYAVKTSVKASLASRTMFQTGIVIFLFILYHLAHYTLHWTHPEYAAMAANYDAYGMVVAGFSSLPISLFYILCVLVLSFHLSHGISSSFQSLGINHSKYNGLIKTAGPIIAWFLGLGFISIPLSVMFGIIQ